MDDPVTAQRKIKDALGYGTGTVTLPSNTSPTGYESYSWHVENVRIGDSYDPSIIIDYRFDKEVDYFPKDRVWDASKKDIENRIRGVTDRHVIINIKLFSW